MYIGDIISIPKKDVEENYEKIHTSECITRQMTAQERLKYFGEERNIVAVKPKVSKDRLFELCKEHGTDWQAAKIIGKAVGLNPTSIISNIKNWGIKQKLEELKTKEQGQEVAVVSEVAEAPKEPEVAAEPVMTISTDDTTPRIAYAEYKIGRLTVGINYEDELIGLDQSFGIAFDEALKLCIFLKETL